MEERRRWALELALAIILIAIVLIISIYVINDSRIQKKDTNANYYTINSYNTYTPEEKPTAKVVYLNENTPYLDNYPYYYNLNDYEKENYVSYHNMGDYENRGYYNMMNYNRMNYEGRNYDWRDYENRGYYYHDRENQNDWDYSYYSRTTKDKEFLGNYVSEYKVYVLNKESKGGYFKVVFDFGDQHGEEYSEEITQYLKAGERKLFLYKDVQFEKREITDWDYSVKKVNF